MSSQCTLSQMKSNTCMVSRLFGERRRAVWNLGGRENTINKGTSPLARAAWMAVIAVVTKLSIFSSLVYVLSAIELGSSLGVVLLAPANAQAVAVLFEAAVAHVGPMAHAGRCVVEDLAQCTLAGLAL